MKSKLLLLAIVAVVNGAPLDISSDNCIANHLKKNDFLSDDFGNEDEVSPTCELIVDNVKMSVYSRLEEAYNEDSEMKDQAQCMLDHMRESEYGDEMLVLYILDRDNVTMSAEEKSEQRAKIMANTYRLTIRALLKCKATDMFGSIFDSMLNDEEEEESEEDFSDTDDYCLRKHIIDNSLLDATNYRLVENPKKIDTSAVDCAAAHETLVSKIEKKMTEFFEKASSSEESDESDDDNGEAECLIKIIKSGSFVDRLAPFDYLKEFRLTDEQKAEERQTFIGILSELTENFTTECVL